MKYTEMEMKVISTIGSVLNYSDLEGNIEDNCTIIGLAEAKEVGIDAKTARGVLSSLVQKGIIWDDPSLQHGDFWVSETGLREYFRLFVDNKEAESTDNTSSKEDTNMTTMIKVTEKATGNGFFAKAIEGGYEIVTLSGEHYKKLKESTFKRNFTIVKEDQPQEKAQDTKTKKQPKTEAHKELTQAERTKMMDKIRKMLNLANNNPSLEEGMAAALQAQKLMAKYNIHQEEVEWEEVKDDIDSIFVEAIEKRVLMAWRKQLALIVGKNFRCKVYMKGNAMAFRGYKQDTKIASEVFKSLYIIGDKLAMKYQAKIQKSTGSGKGMYNSYIAGFLKGIEEGFGEQCTALMIVTPKEVEEEYKEFSKNFGSSNTKQLRIIDAEGFEEGKKDGKAAVKSHQLEKKGA